MELDIRATSTQESVLSSLPDNIRLVDLYLDTTNTTW